MSFCCLKRLSEEEAAEGQSELRPISLDPPGPSIPIALHTTMGPCPPPGRLQPPVPSTLLLTLLHPHSCQWTGQALMCLRAPARTFFPRCPRLPHLLMQSVLSAPSAARLPGATSLKRTISTHSLPPLSLFFLKRRRAPPDQMSPDVSSPQPTYLPVMHLSTCLLSSSCPLPFTHHSKSDPGRGPGR